MKVVIVAVLLGAVALGAGASAYFFFGRPAAKPGPATAKASAVRGTKDKDAAKEKDKGPTKDKDSTKDVGAAKEKDTAARAKEKDSATASAKNAPVAGKESTAASTDSGSVAGSTAKEPGATAATTPPTGNAAATPGDAAAKVPDEIKQLTRLYEGMKPKEAATVLAQLDPELLTTILVTMRERQASKILGLLPTQKAADVSARIARTKPRKDAPADSRTARGGRTS